MTVISKTEITEKKRKTKMVAVVREKTADNGREGEIAFCLFYLGVVEVAGHKAKVYSQAKESVRLILLIILINMLNGLSCKMKDCLNASAIETSLLDVHWLEIEAVAGFRVWQIMFLCFAGIVAIIVILCCCIRFRIPRTKQEIEADYIRKKITKKFQKQLRMIQNADMDDMDLKRALDRIRAEFKSDTESLAQSDALSGVTLSSGNYRLPGDPRDKPFGGSETYRKASYVGISLEEIMEKERRRPSLRTLAGMFSKFRTRNKPHDVLD